MRFRAQCSTCMRVTTDPQAQACPVCGLKRLVVLEGKQIRPAIPPGAARRLLHRAPPEIPEAIRRHVGSSLRRALGWE